MAEEEGCTTNALIAKFYQEILAHRGEVPNFASFLRVTSMRYLRRCVLALERQQPVPTLTVLSNAGRSSVFGSAVKPLAAGGG